MFQLLDTLDQEYERLQALNRWEPRQPAKNPEILALTAELSSLKAYVTKLQKAPVPNPNGNNIKKPTQPPKEGEKETTTLNGITWHYCQKCFGGKGSWNKTHTTAEHVKGAGKGYKGKDGNPPTPGIPEPTSDVAANLARIAPDAEETDDTNGLFFV
jgi:hypothetical protein